MSSVLRKTFSLAALPHHRAHSLEPAFRQVKVKSHRSLPLSGRKLLLPLLQKRKVRQKEIKLFSWGPTGSLW